MRKTLVSTPQFSFIRQVSSSQFDVINCFHCQHMSLPTMKMEKKFCTLPPPAHCPKPLPCLQNKVCPNLINIQTEPNFINEGYFHSCADRWCTSPLSRSPAPDRRILTSSVPASPTNPMRRLIHSPSPLTQSKGLSQLLLLPLFLSKPKRKLYCFFPALNEELKMTLEKRRVSQD